MNDKLWILTEEKPKVSVLLQILTLCKDDFGINYTVCGELQIRPQIAKTVFDFEYILEGVVVENISSVIIKTVSGRSSFMDFLVFKQPNLPDEDVSGDSLLMAIEETKTSDDESRNTGVYQRCSKFVYIRNFYPDAKLYMLYNDELSTREGKRPSDTSIFGTNMLLTLGVAIVGKDISKWFSPFMSLNELISFKANMRKPPAGNVPITITQCTDKIEISGRLSKPANAGNIGHDPSIGGLSIISKCIRTFGYEGDIVISQHGVTQEYIDRAGAKNKFIYICKLLGIKLYGIALPHTIDLPERYWHYERKSEKIASILLHIACEYGHMTEVYQNHAGCERGYFKTPEGKLIALPKKNRNGDNLLIPDVILYDKVSDAIILIEGKKLSTLNDGIAEIEGYGSIEKEYIAKYYPTATIFKYVTIFGGKKTLLPHEKVLLYVNANGQIFLNANSPQCIRQAFAPFV